MNPEVVASPSAFNRVNSHQGNSPFQPKTTINSNELDKASLSKSSSSPAQPIATPPPSSTIIPPHESFVVNKSYEIYLSNCQPPNIVFVATLEDHVRAALLLQMMNKIEKTVESKGNSYETKSVFDVEKTNRKAISFVQILNRTDLCGALLAKLVSSTSDGSRRESRRSEIDRFVTNSSLSLHSQYGRFFRGQTHSCDRALETRPLADE